MKRIVQASHRVAYELTESELRNALSGYLLGLGATMEPRSTVTAKVEDGQLVGLTVTTDFHEQPSELMFPPGARVIVPRGTP